MKPLILILLSFFLSNAALAQEDADAAAAPSFGVATLGAGSQSCSTFLEQTQDQNLAMAYVYWMTGYITGLNNLASIQAASGVEVRGGWIDRESGVANVTRGTSVQQMDQWVRNFCTENPDETYQIAVTALAYALADSLQ